MTCDFCEGVARMTYRGVALCAWHLVLLYLGLHYDARA